MHVNPDQKARHRRVFHVFITCKIYIWKTVDILATLSYNVEVMSNT
jgi:hypothetical protein